MPRPNVDGFVEKGKGLKQPNNVISSNEYKISFRCLKVLLRAFFAENT